MYIFITFSVGHKFVWTFTWWGLDELYFKLHNFKWFKTPKKVSYEQRSSVAQSLEGTRVGRGSGAAPESSRRPFQTLISGRGGGCAEMALGRSNCHLVVMALDWCPLARCFWFCRIATTLRSLGLRVKRRTGAEDDNRFSKGGVVKGESTGLVVF